MEKTMDKIVSLAKARGFVYPGSEIYGGLANTWDYGCLLYTSREAVKPYSITESEPLEHNTYLTCSMTAGDVLNREEYIAFQILDYALCSSQGAPLKQALLDAGIGEDIYSDYDNGTRQPYFSIVAKNADASRKEEFLRIIDETLEKLVAEGLDQKRLQAGLNYYEFKYREADYGIFPAGLMYGLQVMDSWLYDETRPFIHIEAGDTYRSLREKVETGYFEPVSYTHLAQLGSIGHLDDFK